ncbi:MAG: hypothetical protein JWO58_1839 [Chitinophagaceae bacterium]|nr:hypothetical protein [Chitinophagaceae bacterium]
MVSQSKKAIFCWSGGKDSAYALHLVQQENKYEIVFLLTTLNEQFKRISMHGVREELLDVQADALNIPLVKVWVKEGTNNEYERQMKKALEQAQTQGVTHVIFGDIFLEDLRKYREENLKQINMHAVFPLWKKNTTELIQHFIQLKFKTITCCTNDQYLGEEWVGKEVNEEFVKSLPSAVDPCGENGEYHTFCYAGPIFRTTLSVEKGEKIYRPLEIKVTDDCSLSASQTKGFWFCDLIKE